MCSISFGLCALAQANRPSKSLGLVASATRTSRRRSRTTDEEEHDQLVVALLFWRRQIISRHFAAWKKAALRYSCQRAYERAQEKRPGSYIQKPLAWHRSKESRLLRSVRRGRSATSPSRYAQPSLHVKTTFAKIRGQQVDQFDKSNRQAERATLARRRVFQASLQLVYFTFSRWRDAVKDLQREQKKLEQFALQQHQQRCKQVVLDAWKHRVLESRRRFRQWETAIDFDDSACQRRYFLHWKRMWKRQCEADRRRSIIASRLVWSCFCRWAKFVTAQQKLQARFDKAQRRSLRRAIERFRCNAQHLKAGRLDWAQAASHHDRNLRAAMFAVWKAHVLSSPEYVLSLRRAKIAALRTGIRRWSRFMQRRRHHAHCQLQADFVWYQSSMKRSFRRWCQYRDMLRRRRDVWVTAENQHNANLTRQTLRVWLRYRQARVDARDQLTKAAQWHRARSITSFFGLWRETACIASLSRRVFNARRVRQAKLAFISWRVWAVRSRVNRGKYCFARRRHHQIMLTQAWSTWRETHRRSVTFSLLACQRQRSVLAQHIVAWRHVARASRRYGYLVQSMQAKSSRHTLQLALKAWAGITLRRRCCSQLIKLFRKKTKRILLKRTFRLLRVSVRCSERQRRREHEMIRHAFFRCWSFVAARKSDRARDQLASEYFYSRQCSFAMRRWALACRAQRRYRVAILTVLKHHHDGIVRRALHGWYLAARRLRRRAELLAARRLQREQRLTRSVMWVWYVFAQARRRRDLQTRMARRHHIDRQCRLIWQAWVQSTSCQRYSRHLTLMAVESHAHRCYSRVFSSWRRVAKYRRKLRIRQEEVRDILMGKRLSLAIATWRRNHHKRVDARRLYAMSAAFYNETMLCRTLLMWQAYWYTRALKRDQQNAVVAAIRRKRLRSTIKSWYRRCLTQKSRREAQKRADGHRYCVLGHRGIERWRQNHSCRQQSRRKRLVATSHYRQSALRSVFKLWGRYSSRQHEFKTQLQRIFRSEARFALRQVFDQWRRYRRTSTLRRIAEAFHNRALCQRVWRHWTAHCQFVAKMNKSTLVTGQLLRGNALRAAFVAWQAYISLRYRHLEHLEAADVYWQQFQCRTGVRRWKAFHDRLQREQAALEFALTRRKRHFFQRWRRYIEQVGGRERRWNHAAQWRRHKLLSKCWSQWATTTHRAVQGRVSQLDAHFNKVLVKKTWASWRRLLDRARVAAVIRTRRKDACTRSTWSQWLKYLAARAERKQQYSKLSALYRSTQRSRAWSAWREYVEYRHLRCRQYEQAHEHYATHIFRRRHFSAWARYALYQRDRRERLILAAEHVVRARLHSVLRRWVAYWKQRVMRRQQDRHYRSQIVCLRLARSVTKWQAETRWAAKQRQAQQLGVCHYRERRMAAALAAFRYWKEEKQLSRRQLAQASAFLRTQLLGGFFRRWHSYHLWRRHNRRLVRLFRESRKDDFFYRWKAFWSGMKAKTAKTLKARTLYCTRTEHRYFQRWVQHITARRQKARADKLYTDRIQFQCFFQWKRRVRVIQQMRRLVRSQAFFRLEVHFSAWQRFVCSRKHQMQRFECAMSFMKRSRMEKHWAKWSLFMAHQHEERAVVKKAERFRRRFMTWRLLNAWRSHAHYWKRKRVLGAAASQASRSRWLLRIMSAWASWGHQQRALRSRQAQFRALFARKRTEHAVYKLLQLVNERRAVKARRTRADLHWNQRASAKYWHRWQYFHHLVKSRHAQVASAEARYHGNLLRRCFTTTVDWFLRSKATRARLSAFRCRYFATVVERCFGRWRCAAVLRRELRRIIHRSDALRRLELLLQWRRNAVNAATRRAQREKAGAHFRSRQLARWFQHWESVSTDRWIAQRLVLLHTRERRRLLALQGVERWREAVGERRRARLAMVLRAWRRAVDGSGCTNI